MIKLKKPLLWDGHIVPAGRTVALPEKMEKRIISAGNAEYASSSDEKETKNAEQPQNLGGKNDQQNGTPQTPEPDPELSLGRQGPAQ